MNESTDALTVYHTRPTDKRLPKEEAVYDLLEQLSVDYTRVDHPAALTMDDCIAAGKALGAPICKNLFLCNRQKTVFYLLLIPADKEFRTKNLSAQIGSARLSFADEASLLELLHLTPGSVSVMGLLNDPEQKVTLLIDSDVLQADFFGCHPCINTSSICFTTKALTEIILPALHRTPRIVHL